MRDHPLKVFLSYAGVDEDFIVELIKHLSPLERRRLIEHWHHQRLSPGDVRADDISSQLENADIIIFGVSPDFLASRDCYDVQLARALERHEQGTARVVPIILRPSNWHSSAFSRFQVLPKDGKPLSLSASTDQAWLDVTAEIEVLVEKVKLEFAATDENSLLRESVRQLEMKERELQERCATLEKDLVAVRERNARLGCQAVLGLSAPSGP